MTYRLRVSNCQQHKPSANQHQSTDASNSIAHNNHNNHKHKHHFYHNQFKSNNNNNITVIIIQVIQEIGNRLTITIIIRL